jgi:hypothetical protein
LLLGGCFYIDPINQRPTIDGFDCEILESDRPCQLNGKGFVVGYVHRGDRVELKANVTDPEGHDDKITYSWGAHPCTASDARLCSPGPAAFGVATDSLAQITVLEVPKDLDGGIHAIRVDLQVRDDRGALDSASLAVLVNDAPTLELRRSARSYTVGAPIDLFAKYGDPDDGPGSVTLSWGVVAPNTQPTLDDLDIPPDGGDPAHLTVGKTLVPQGSGDWEVIVTATDPVGALNEQHLAFTVSPDQPPCLARSQPVVPPAGFRLPLAEPTLFQVALVDDDLDPYPAMSDDPHFGTATFAWSILPPDASVRQPLVGATGNTVEFDPRAFTPGKIVELRVEIFDRNQTAMPCADKDATCSVSSQPDCLQRQTWRVEAQ